LDIKLFYVEKGIGQPLVLLHGNGESHQYFENQMEFFSKSYRVIAIDTRGHGNSQRGEAPFTIAQFADDLYEFMLEQRLPRASILGFSDGANIALTFALKHSGIIEKLILNGADLNPEGVKRTIQIPIEIGYKIASLFAHKNEEAKKKAEMLGLMVNEPNIATEQLASLTVPTLIIAGTKDMIKDSHTRLIYQSLPNAQLSFVRGDHFIAKKNPDEFNQIVCNFMCE